MTVSTKPFKKNSFATSGGWNTETNENIVTICIFNADAFLKSKKVQRKKPWFPLSSGFLYCKIFLFLVFKKSGSLFVSSFATVALCPHFPSVWQLFFLSTCLLLSFVFHFHSFSEFSKATTFSPPSFFFFFCSVFFLFSFLRYFFLFFVFLFLSSLL
jgi:hypothetical protein